MRKDLKLVYFYRNKDDKRLQRTFWLSEIKQGEDEAHLKLIPGYWLESIQTQREINLIKANYLFSKELHELQQLQRLQFKRVVGAQKLWQQENGEAESTFADLGELIEWLIERGNN